ncbi:MAG: hypothetical protein A3G51_01380 [Candidatus Yanofskybacteria bacterium RIFCSPLOWO2_12_FULL_43_11b]|uniref:Endolytic murein transglycosylase n=1 Tax=Candidatus Yanofskybacteria bacterium RIFCSPLOWO2_12_FULL_43_11b TaxID=1802710 RepID=A0A1F8H7C5_9BACT|nr:MAG: hypothetical protein A2742_01525 [Candidatus Yanofskybacteria bacterium RIFCSPHIGHO2_01_FULL_43_32]OGN17841.1 MAG: hypothetical protein A3E34_01260 [Candidatus Yanofskybacteria bacterium RIFCSPHIGHO2_12_FULL_43_11]OGN24800.1 MAG: hypothetical protein A2923_03215 [Candidatus Yanofskybacteria bacterium RIFCSPLOWO2_01_FULL_43_46]OGN33424.1 MAG: hypothetical protein A3G51_01380 [Candidatus Yanofskybacteria bacterium RIFCSPLOWO2_12_FULL_43_11b]
MVAVSVFLGWMSAAIIRSPLDAPKEIIIKEGEGAYAIADTLKKEGIIENKFVFVAYVFITGNEKKLQAGRYLFKPGVIIPNIIHSIAGGLAETDDIIVTIPEGFNVWEIDKRLAGLGLIVEGEFAKKYQPQEGEFFPDTYRFDKKGETVDTIAEKMKNHLNLKFKEFSLIFSSLILRDTLTRASILEKEARNEEDMRLVAGVIRNRLAKKMTLQIDATVSYGACLRKATAVDFKKNCDVSQIPVGAEIRIDSPYNSYKRSGLPPGPIANPGITAIQAVLNPKQSDYLYYLSTRDGSQMIFSKTAAEHATNRRKYLGI